MKPGTREKIDPPGEKRLIHTLREAGYVLRND
jgi:DNA-binding response OmpR family regulator